MNTAQISLVNLLGQNNAELVSAHGKSAAEQRLELDIANQQEALEQLASNRRSRTETLRSLQTQANVLTKRLSAWHRLDIDALEKQCLENIESLWQNTGSPYETSLLENSLLDHSRLNTYRTVKPIAIKNLQGKLDEVLAEIAKLSKANS